MFALSAIRRLFPITVYNAIEENLDTEKLQEIRMRAGKPITVQYGGKYWYLSRGGITEDLSHGLVVNSVELNSCVVNAAELHLALLVHQRRQQRDRQRDIVRLRRVVRQLLELAVGAQAAHFLHLAEVAQIVQNVELEPVVALRRELDVRRLHELQQLLRGHQSLLHHELPAQQAVGLGSSREKPDRFVDVMMAKKIVENGLGVRSTVAAVHVGADGDQAR